MVFATFRPLEVSHFRSRDAAAAVLLASSLNWTINQQHNGPVSLVAEDGKQIRVPDNTGIKMDIFRSWIHQIATHSNASINRKLVDDIVKTTKLGREHARLMYDLVEEEEPDRTIDVGPSTVTGPPLLPQGSYTAEAFVVSREPIEPYHDNPEYAWKRTWSDGHVDYECMHCERLFDSVKGVGAHQQFHIRRGQVEGKRIKGRPGAPETRRRFIPPDEPLRVTKRGQAEPRTDEVEVKMIEVSEKVITDSLEALKTLEQIKSLLGAGEVSALKEQLAAKEARITQLEGNLQALRDLLSGDL